MSIKTKVAVPPRPYNKAQRLCQELEAQLLAGELLPGNLLPSERNLAQEHQLSRSVVREAMQLLASRGLIETYQGGGSRLLNPLAHYFEQASLGRGVAENSTELQLAVLEMRWVLEGEAAFYCAQRATEEELQALQVEFARMEARRDEPNTLERAKADLHFHMLIAQCSHHFLLIALAQVLYSRFFNAIYGVLSKNQQRTGSYPPYIESQHERIYQAIVQRQPEQARQAAQAHILYTRQRLEEMDGVPGR